MKDIHLTIQRLFGPNAQVVEVGGEYYLDVYINELGDNGSNIQSTTDITAEGIFLAMVQRWFLYQSQIQTRLLEITRKNPTIGTLTYQNANGDDDVVDVNIENFTIKIYGKASLESFMTPDQV